MRRMQTFFTTISTALLGAILIAGTTLPAHAQAFAELKSALVDYSKAETEPRKACEAMSGFKSRDIAGINSVMIAADAAAPAHCRVTGVLSPEIAFEVSWYARWDSIIETIASAMSVLDDSSAPCVRIVERGAAPAIAETGLPYVTAYTLDDLGL